MTWNPHVGDLYAVQHGRDDLYRSWPQYFSRWQSAVLPSEEFFRVTEGFDGGWPYYYFDWMQGKKLLNPEYGGDGKKEGEGAKLRRRSSASPATSRRTTCSSTRATQFPERYRHGAFIAFHGSTIRMPYSQAGYIVAFVPLKDGKARRRLGSVRRRLRRHRSDPEHRRRGRRGRWAWPKGPTARSTSATASRAGSGGSPITGDRDAFGTAQLTRDGKREDRSRRTSGSPTSRRT